MAATPRGEPRTVPDPAGDQYDEAMAKVREKRRAEDAGMASPVSLAGNIVRDFQAGPPIKRPSLAQSLIPVVGPAWEATADFQEGDYAGAAFNGAMALADVLPVGVVAKGARMMTKGVGILKDGSVTANATAKQLRRKGIAGPGQEIHHTVPLNGTGRTVQDWRNHFAFVKVMPKEQHRRLTGSWNGKPRYDPIRRIWYGTTDWQKVFPTTVVMKTADGIQNSTTQKRR
jgi:hypothetical protein